jgi:hypothetical protein
MLKIENFKNDSGHFNFDKNQVILLLELILTDLRKAMYDPENPESTANSLGKCSRCGQLLPRT